MNTTQLECFLAVAEHLNFSRASEELKMTQPAVSHQIRSLETGSRPVQAHEQERHTHRGGHSFSRRRAAHPENLLAGKGTPGQA